MPGREVLIMNKSKANTKRIVDLLINNAIIIILLIMVLFVGITQDNFVSKNNFLNISMNTAVRFIVAVGVSGCLIVKGTDLSAGRIVGMGACIAGTLLQRADASNKFFPNLGEMNMLLVFLLIIVICGIAGLVNGLIIAFLKVPPFIATLGMQTVIYGICLVYTGASPLGSFRSDYTAIGTQKILWGWLPYLVIFALVIGVAMWFLYNMCRHGKYMYAIGGNEVSAEVSGVNVKKTLIIIYTLAAALYGIAGFLLAAKSGGATVNSGDGYELEAIAACTIGGVSTSGGVGKISGILLGVLVFELLKTSLQFLGVGSDYTYIVQGVVIVFAVALDIRKYIAKK